MNHFCSAPAMQHVLAIPHCRDISPSTLCWYYVKTIQYNMLRFHVYMTSATSMQFQSFIFVCY